MLRFLLFIILGLTNINLLAQSLTVDEKVDSLLQLMTLEEKIGQMAQAERGALEKLSDISFYKLGSLLSGGGSAPETNNVAEWAKMYDNYQQEALKTRLRIPLIYGIDAVHGHNNVYGAVIFPHNIGLGCTRNPDLIEEVNRITAKEVAATGIDWTFSPCIAVPKNEKWEEHMKVSEKLLSCRKRCQQLRSRDFRVTSVTQRLFWPVLSILWATEEQLMALIRVIQKFLKNY